MQALTKTYLNNPLWAWMIAALAVAVTVSVGAIVRGLLRKRLRAGTGPGEGLARNVLQRVALNSSIALLLGISLWFAGLILTLPDKWEGMLRTTAILALAGQVALWLHGVLGSPSTGAKRAPPSAIPAPPPWSARWDSWARSPSGP